MATDDIPLAGHGSLDDRAKIARSLEAKLVRLLLVSWSLVLGGGGGHSNKLVLGSGHPNWSACPVW